MSSRLEDLLFSAKNKIKKAFYSNYEYSITKRDIIEAVEVYDGTHFTADELLENIYLMKGVPEEYQNLNRDIQFVYNYLKNLQKRGKIERFDVYFLKKREEGNNLENYEVQKEYTII